MGAAGDMTRRHARGVAPLAVLAVATVAAGCAVFGHPNTDVELPESSPAQEDEASSDTATTVVGDTAAAPPSDSLEERMLAGDYEGVLVLYAADSTLHADEDATYRAALAAATSGHPAHDPRRAAELFGRLLERHPDTARRLEVEVYLDMLARERELRGMIGRLDRELQQLKAIDLGQEPAGQP